MLLKRFEISRNLSLDGMKVTAVIFFLLIHEINAVMWDIYG